MNREKRIMRAESGYLAYYNLQATQRYSIKGKRLEILEQWLKTGKEDELIHQLKEIGFIRLHPSQEEKATLKERISTCRETEAPLRSMVAPDGINIELTTRCPLDCPQCYCELDQGKDIDKETAFKCVDEAASLQIPFFNLSGGETLVYPHLFELIEHISERGLHSSIAISGWGFDDPTLMQLKEVGLNRIFISLNGSTESINSKSRGGYKYAINALEILQRNPVIDSCINWVARNDNVADFPKMVDLTKKYGVTKLGVLLSKPDSSKVLQESLSAENFLFLANFIKNYKDRDPQIMVEPCFSNLRAYIYDNGFLNHNIGFSKGCEAGRLGISLDVDGNYTPCRHLLIPEKYNSIVEYWWSSKTLDALRRYEDFKEEPCVSCPLTRYCLPCRSIGEKVYQHLYKSDPHCPVPHL